MLQVTNFISVNFIYVGPQQYKIKITDNSAVSDITITTDNLMRTNNNTHIAISQYDDGITSMVKMYINGKFIHNQAIKLNALPAATNLQLVLGSSVYFKFARLWNLNMKPYPLM